MTAPAHLIDPEAFRARARRSLRAEPLVQLNGDHPGSPLARSPSDYDLAPDARPAVPEAPPRPAAVLVPLVAREPGLTVLLTQRSAHLPSHAGQIAFPGGKIEPDDAGALGAALREAHEEIGLDPVFVDPLGYVEPYETGTGFLVTPVVAAVRTGFTLMPDPREVDAIFEVPLDFLLNEGNHLIEARLWQGQERRYYAIPHQERYIWGATAGIIRALHRRLHAL